MLGLQNCKFLFVGGAPVSEELKRFFLGLDLPLTEVFGMSETSGAITLNLDYSKLRSVGKPIADDLRIRIDQPSEAGEGQVSTGKKCWTLHERSQEMIRNPF